MLLKDALLRDPSQYDLVNNGQARIQNESADEKMLAQLRGELSSFVCEGQYADGMARILESFLRDDAAKSASGLGKRILWQRKVSPAQNAMPPLAGYRVFRWRDRAAASFRIFRRMSAAHFLNSTSRAANRADYLAAAGTLPAGTTENVRLVCPRNSSPCSPASGSISAGAFPTVARRARHFAKVKSAVEAAGKDWQRELNSLYVSPLIAKALMSCDAHFASTEAEARETLRKQFPPRMTDLTSDELLTMFQRVLRRHGKGKSPCTILILDEVQQYIGDSETRSVHNY